MIWHTHVHWTFQANFFVFVFLGDSLCPRYWGQQVDRPPVWTNQPQIDLPAARISQLQDGRHQAKSQINTRNQSTSSWLTSSHYQSTLSWLSSSSNQSTPSDWPQVKANQLAVDLINRANQSGVDGSTSNKISPNIWLQHLFSVKFV